MKNLEKIQELFQIARQDGEYAQMAEEYLALEEQFEAIVSRMPMEEQNIMWGYVCLAEDMNRRMLEIVLERT